jgi:hypothetical protein
MAITKERLLNLMIAVDAIAKLQGRSWAEAIEFLFSNPAFSAALEESEDLK